MASAIRSTTTQDAVALARIYNHYILNTVVTFEEQAVSAEEMAARIEEVAGHGLPWLIAERDGEVLGYACASRWKPRSAYRHSVEITVYLDPAAAGQGLGTQLYQALFAALRQRSIHVVIGGIALPNEASIALHEMLGLTKVAHFREVGFKFNRWVDVGYWQALL